ncbi:asparagine synthase C-terminal domain-containing protein [Streptomyces sp. NPDC006610]|uniref:asparagine synthetase B family protein n=1 Tax=Streptomyces sp. NPDC006610 TaxID=3154584 RepID=UPI0033BF086C
MTDFLLARGPRAVEASQEKDHHVIELGPGRGALLLHTGAGPAEHAATPDGTRIALPVTSANHRLEVDVEHGPHGTVTVRPDPAGVPAVHYCRIGEDVLVGTDLAWLARARARLTGAAPSPDPEALALYLAFQYVPAPWTIWSGIRQLRAGAHLEIGPQGPPGEVPGTPLPAADGSPSEPATDDPRVLAEIGAVCLDRVEAALRTGLRDAGSVACLLSGGMDTSTNVAVLARRLGIRATAYTASFEDPEFDESRYAATVARHFGLDHHLLRIRPADAGTVAGIAARFESPHGDRAIFAQHFLYDRVAADGHDVLVTGEGGDEIMGFPRTRDGDEELVLPAEPAALARTYLGKTCLAPAPLRAEFFRGLGVDPDLPYGVLEECYRAQAARDPFERVHVGQWRTWMVHGVYVKDTRLARGAGLRVVLPFMDGELMREMARVPAGRKRGGLADKAFVKAALAGVLPQETLVKKKQKFWLPFADWFRGPWHDLLHDALLGGDSWAGRTLDREVTRRLVAEHERGVDHSRLLWALLFLDLWGREAHR